MTTIREYAELYNDLSNNTEYTQIPFIPNEWKVIRDSAEINTFLPKKTNITVTTGITTHKKHHSKNFESIDLSQTIKNKRGHIINTGGSIWGIDFVSRKASLDDDKTHYLAVGGYNSVNEHHHFKKEEDVEPKNAIQIWRFTDEIPPILDMCILHEFGIVIDFKWCPFSAYDKEDKLGILAVLFGDGDIRLFVVPHSHLVRHQEMINQQETIFLKVGSPRLLLKLPRTYNLCFAWGGCGRFASGTKSGKIVVWDILNSLVRKTPVIHVTIPNASLSAIKSISWLSLLDNDLFVSADAGGCLRLHDLADPFVPLRMFRVRSTYICVLGTGHGKEFLFSDLDGVTRKNSSFTNKFSITLTMHNSMVWAIAVSPYHGVIASAGSDGSVMVKTYSHDAYNMAPRHKLDVPEFTLYKLTYDAKTKEFQYIDGIKTTTNLPERAYHKMFIDPIVSIHKVAWNNNKNGCGWVASGGEAGLCRLDYTGCG